MSPKYFAVMFMPRSWNDGKPADQELFHAATGLTPNLECETTGFRVTAAYSPRVRLASSDTVTLLLQGRLYSDDPQECIDPAQTLLNIYLRFGILSLARGLHGSCAVLIIDKRNDRIAIITDRVNSRKVFLGKYEDSFLISTSLRDFSTKPLDPAGVASYLINRYLYRGRTVYAGVETLERASIHVLGRKGFVSERYWSYDFSESSLRRGVSAETGMQADLKKLLELAVARRIPEKGRVLCSLSGGADSRVMLGLLSSNVDRSRLTTLSYGAAADDDVDVAALLSAELGINRLRYGFEGDLAKTIRMNGEYCEGLVFFYPQGLEGLAERVGDISDDNVLFVGDECFGWQDMELDSFCDVLKKSVGIQSPVYIPEYYSYGKFSHADIRDVLSEDNWALEQSCLNMAEWHDIKDFLYLDQRLPYMLLNWREFHASRFVEVANPWLDNDILDFMKTVPTSLRIDKQLFRTTAASMFPKLFSVRFAKPGGVSNEYVNSLLRLQRSSIEPLITSFDSLLDDLFPPDLILSGYLDIINRMGLDKRRLPRDLRAFLERLHRKYLQIRVSLNTTRPSRRTGAQGRGLMALGPMQMHSLLTLRLFLRKG